MNLNLKLDFGVGRLTPVAHNGSQWVRFDDLVRFLEGDGEVMLAEARDSSLSSKLVELADGTVLLPWELIPTSMFVWPTDALGAEHRDAHTAWCRAALRAGGVRELGARIAADLVPPGDAP